MKLVKYYVWERFFEKKVANFRKDEMKYMFWNAVIKTVNVTMVFGVPPTVAFATLVPYELQNGDNTAPYLTPQTSFVLLSLFNILRFPLVVLPKVQPRVHSLL
jgi:ATP-binding cassette subfamily C (CFTR/MRP) protein 1